MRLIEADGKRLLANIGIAVPDGVFLNNGDNPATLPFEGACVVKAQVLQGRRGKSGLVRGAADTEGAREVVRGIRACLGNTPCAGFLIERNVPHEREFLVSADIDRRSGELRLTVSAEGGTDVRAATTTLVASPADVDALDVPDGVRRVARSLFEAFATNDLLSAEINPLAVLASGDVVALDAKIEIDETAAFRHPEWETLCRLPKFGRAPTPFEQAYDAFRTETGHRGTFGELIELDGDLALVLSGGGASLLALDALARAGGRAANYCEFSGNPEPEAARKGAAIIFSRPNIRGIWIAGSDANFTDIQATVSAMLQAVLDAGLRVPVVIRRDGPNADEAEKETIAWGRAHGIPVRFHRANVSLEESATELMRLVASIPV